MTVSAAIAGDFLTGCCSIPCRDEPSLPSKTIVWLGLSGVSIYNGAQRAPEVVLTSSNIQPESVNLITFPRSYRIYGADVELGVAESADVRVTVTQHEGSAAAEPTATFKDFTVSKGYPASVSLRIPPSNVATIIVELEGYTSEEYVQDRSSSLFAAVFPASVTATELEPLFHQLALRNVRVEKKLRRTPTNEAFFLFDVGEYVDVKQILDMVSTFPNYIDSGDPSSANWAIAMVLDRRANAAKLLVLDPVPRDKASYDVKITEIIPPQLVPKNPADEFLRRATEPDARLRFVREMGKKSRKVQAPTTPRMLQSTVVSDPLDEAGFAQARARLSTLGRVSNGVLAAPWSIATIEAGPVNALHPWVDLCNLTQVVLCDDDLQVLAPGRQFPPECRDRLGAGATIHATAVYGLLSARDPAENACDQNAVQSTAEMANGACRTGAVTGVKHVSLCAIDPIPGTSADTSCFRIADGIRWLAGLPTPHHSSWPPLSDHGAIPARVINISRAFPLLLDPTLSSSARAYLRQTLQDVTTLSHDGLGTVVVIALENSANMPYMEDQLSLPCRNSLLIVAACSSAGASVFSARLTWGPIVSLVAPSNELDLLSVPGIGQDQCGHFTAPAASFSTAIVSGAATVILAARPDLNARQVSTILRHTASQVDVAPDPEDDRSEDIWFRMLPDRTGIVTEPPDAQPSLSAPSLVGASCWTSLRYGHGNLNLLGALSSAEAMPRCS